MVSSIIAESPCFSLYRLKASSFNLALASFSVLGLLLVLSEVGLADSASWCVGVSMRFQCTVNIVVSGCMFLGIGVGNKKHKKTIVIQ